MKIQIITTGGTIDKVYFDAKSDYEIGESQVAEILKESNVTLEYAVRELLHKDSLDSRYTWVGLVTPDLMVGKAYPLW